MSHHSKDSLKAKRELSIEGKSYTYYSVPEAAAALGIDHAQLPYSLKVLLENLLRNEDGVSVKSDDLQAMAEWLNTRTSEREIAFLPARVLMQDFTGVPAVVDLAAMRDAMLKRGGDPERINPLAPVDLVIDHSVQVDFYGDDAAFKENVRLEFERNRERYQFLRWGQEAFNNFRVVPPGTGICHQVNLEYLARVAWTNTRDGHTVVYPDTLVGTDSHTTMVNGLSVLGWGVGGIEAEAAMLGQPITMLIPEVIGFKLTGQLPEGSTATDLVLTVTQMLRKKGVVGKFVEFYGEGLAHLPLADRATIANMAPEYGATCGFFPIDEETIRYLSLTGRDAHLIALVEANARAQGLWRADGAAEPVYTDTLELDLGEVVPSLAGPKRPQDRVVLGSVHESFATALPSLSRIEGDASRRYEVENANFTVGHGDVVIAAITSCTNTSNPSVMIAAGLVARKAAALGLKAKPWVKTSLAPGSQVVSGYLEDSGLMKDLEKVGFYLVGYGCTTCIGNSGPLDDNISKTITDHDLAVASVLSGNRNFEGRVHPLVKANYLASPPLVVAYALAGTTTLDLTSQPIGTGANGQPVYLKDIWPSSAEVRATIDQFVTSRVFKAKYANVFDGDELWQSIQVPGGLTYAWDDESTYVKNPPYFDASVMGVPGIANITGARILALLGDSITTDHISPAGNISKKSPAAQYLFDKGVSYEDFNSYGARRGNHEIMMRGTFANIRIKNEMLGGVEGGYALHIPTGEQLSIYDAAMRYQKEATPLVIIAGKEYGTGSSRDWAAKGTRLLGVRAVIAESFERIHRSNLVGMGVLPLMFQNGESRQSLGLTGHETVSISGLSQGIRPRMSLDVTFTSPDGTVKQTTLLCRIDTVEEVGYFKSGGILQYVVDQVATRGAQAA